MTTTREQFILTTCDLLEVQGYHATGLNQIINESGGPKGSLYYHFPDGKEGLTAEALQHVGQIVLRRIKTNLAVADNPADAVRDFILNVAYNVEHSGYQAGGPITTVALETASSSERLREICNAIYADWQTAFRERLTAGGVPDPAADQIARVIVAGLEGGIILCRTGRTQQPLHDVAATMETVIRASM